MAVLDTNVLASGAISRPGSTISRIIIAARQAAFQLVLSEPIVTELQRTLANPYYTSRISPKDALDYESFLLRVATHASMTTPVTGVATHPEDDPLLATAVSARGRLPRDRRPAPASPRHNQEHPDHFAGDFVTIVDSQR